MCVLPTMTYGCETWTTTKYLEQKLMTAQHAMERRMLNITLRDKVRNSEIRNKNQSQRHHWKIKEAKWRWAGHVAKRNDNRWTKRLTEWQPRQERGGGDDKNADGGTTWLHMWAQLGRDWRRTEADGFYMRRATPDFGWNSQQGKARYSF